MSDPPKKAPSPDQTLVDPLEDSVAPTTVNPEQALTPVGGKRPTNASLPAQAPDRKRTSGKRPTAQREALPAVEGDTRIAPMPKAAPPAVTAESGPDATVTGDDPAGPDDNPTPLARSTYDLERGQPTKSFVGLDDKQFRRALWALSAGAAAVVVLFVAWLTVKLDDRPAQVGTATPIPHAIERPKPKVEPAIEAPRPLMIEQTVDAGLGETRTVLASAGTVRIVTDPDANVFYEGKDLGLSPVLVTLPAGKSTVTLENAKLFFKRTVTVEVKPDEQGVARFQFGHGWLEIDAPKESKVTVDGRPATSNHVQVWEGMHKVEAVHADKKKTHASQTAEVPAGMTTSVHFDAPSLADE